MQRRQFIADSVRLALGARAAVLLSGAFPASLLADNHAQVFSEQQLRTLTAMARALVPHEFIADEKYLGAALSLDQQAATRPGIEPVLVDGLQRMDANAPPNWLAASVDDKLATLEQLQREDFFRIALHGTIDTLYRDPEVFQVLGYEGSSIEFGGYLTRGFDDIDWLPKT